MTNIPEAGGVAWTELYTSTGMKINLTSRAETPGMAVKNLLAAIEEQHLSAVRPAINQPPAPDPFPDDLSWNQPEPEPPSVAHQEAKAQAIPTTGSDLGLLTYAPKATEMKPGDQFRIMVNQYKATAEKIAFYRKGAQYPIFTHYFSSDYATNKFAEMTNNWQPPEDNEMHDMPETILTIVASDKLNSKGNPYRNLEMVQRA